MCSNGHLDRSKWPRLKMCYFQVHLLTTGTDDPSLTGALAIIKVLGHQYWWLVGGRDLEIGQFQKWLAWWVPGGYPRGFLA